MAEKKANFFQFVPLNKKQRRFALLKMSKSSLVYKFLLLCSYH